MLVMKLAVYTLTTLFLLFSYKVHCEVGFRGEPFTFHCTHSFTGVLKVTWYQTESLKVIGIWFSDPNRANTVHNPYNTTTAFIPSQNEFTISNLDINRDDGIFFCEIHNGILQNRIQINLTVYVKPFSVSLLSGQHTSDNCGTQINSMTGPTELAFTCYASCRPDCIFLWTAGTSFTTPITSCQAPISNVSTCLSQTNVTINSNLKVACAVHVGSTTNTVERCISYQLPGKKGVNIGLIVGIVTAVVVVIGVVVAVLMYQKFNRKDPKMCHPSRPPQSTSSEKNCINNPKVQPEI